MECFSYLCEIFKISCLMGRHRVKDVLENLLKDQSFRLVHWLSITLSLRKTSQESINLERKPYLDIMVADIEELEKMDASEIFAKRLNTKEVIFSKENGKSIFPVADGRIKFEG